MLLAIERKSPKKRLETLKEWTPAEKRHIFESECKNFIYHIGIIDYLTDFNFNKQVENWYKTKIKGKDPKKLSAVKPLYYS